ncbi:MULTISPECIES: efflux RND transporter periplasmic adaptor subunit [Yersinia pseudotuberculosis complex]|uniref:Efflux ABC transporter, RND family, MFP subunit n=1 Tax=Yersinia pseudotuberculosis serotype O:1b (strain IP 31758) TaxID=349747 RepID=A0A0U1R1V0_YERP3|nr:MULTISPECIES: efflux RND transporter periplasmic adaptor subunit [Yersinia pseudotuberculosis complex]ABS49204.1 efflux ABC transporter, RND family, MFP subunit [Yersinia pseudotuberculosis IP 31758]AJK15204.1 efflux transporter, RND family, MFP subunit [Yersinia pseudotuberculosis str. PA3606]MBO1552164.1 efflux RND transporter periplasmic adaptor subunit [Yersinia pseudotuberculosis]MBO1572383.1 efflux RND transporter periplasmic adaptor subunit [Yersinia pseudotuberculosis]MBO1587300.1 e
MQHVTGSKRRLIGWVVLLLIIGGLLFFRWISPPDKPSYITAVAEIRDLEQTVLADGTIKAQKQVTVGAQVSGQIKALHVTLGQQVEKNQLVAEIDDLAQQNALKDAEEALKNVQAQRAAKIATQKNNQLTYQRQQQILAKGVGVRADFDSIKAILEATQAEISALDAQIAQAEIAVSTAKLNLGYTKISSPIAGTVVAIPVEEGQTVNAVQSAPTIIKVAQLDTMTVEAQISEADVVKVKTGMPVYFTILGEPEKRFSATLRAIEPAPDSINDETTTTSSSTSSSSSSSTAIYYNGLFDVANPTGALRISMTAQVYILLNQAKNAVVIPATALENDQGQYRVQVVDNSGKVSQRTVTVGLNNNVDAQILTGLQAGEHVIVSQGSTTSTNNKAPRMGPPMGM